MCYVNVDVFVVGFLLVALCNQIWVPWVLSKDTFDYTTGSESMIGVCLFFARRLFFHGFKGKPKGPPATFVVCSDAFCATNPCAVAEASAYRLCFPQGGDHRSTVMLDACLNGQPVDAPRACFFLHVLFFFLLCQTSWVNPKLASGCFCFWSAGVGGDVFCAGTVVNRIVFYSGGFCFLGVPFKPKRIPSKTQTHNTHIHQTW